MILSSVPSCSLEDTQSMTTCQQHLKLVRAIIAKTKSFAFSSCYHVSHSILWDYPSAVKQLRYRSGTRHSYFLQWCRKGSPPTSTIQKEAKALKVIHVHAPSKSPTASQLQTEDSNFLRSRTRSSFTTVQECTSLGYDLLRGQHIHGRSTAAAQLCYISQRTPIYPRRAKRKRAKRKRVENRPESAEITVCAPIDERKQKEYTRSTGAVSSEGTTNASTVRYF